jgi:hypothetical protein
LPQALLEAQMKGILLATAILIAVNAHAGATTIVFLFNPTTVVVGADSKLTNISVPDALVCKIGVIRNVVWAAAGDLTFSGNRSVADIVNIEMNKNLPIQQTIDNIKNILGFYLSSILDNAKEGGIPRFIKGGQVDYEALRAHLIIQIAFGYIDNATVNTDFIQISLPQNPGPNDTVKITGRAHCPSISCRPEDHFLLGWSEIIGPELSADPGVVGRLGAQLAIDHFIEEEAAVHKGVSAPAAVVRLSGGGVEWLEKGKCD